MHREIELRKQTDKQMVCQLYVRVCVSMVYTLAFLYHSLEAPAGLVHCEVNAPCHQLYNELELRRNI